jgi:hypothetical protein
VYNFNIMKKKHIKKIIKNADFNRWLDKNTTLLIDLYGIGNITLSIDDQSGNAPRNKQGADVLFRIHYSLPYRTANIWYYQKAINLFKEKNFSVLRIALTHEIAHILTSPLADLATNRYVSHREIEDCLEHLTETIGQLCRKLLAVKKIEMN